MISREARTPICFKIRRFEDYSFNWNLDLKNLTDIPKEAVNIVLILWKPLDSCTVNQVVLSKDPFDVDKRKIRFRNFLFEIPSPENSLTRAGGTRQKNGVIGG
jgi:hypothetical protein